MRRIVTILMAMLIVCGAVFSAVPITSIHADGPWYTESGVGDWCVTVWPTEQGYCPALKLSISYAFAYDLKANVKTSGALAQALVCTSKAGWQYSTGGGNVKLSWSGQTRPWVNGFGSDPGTITGGCDFQITELGLFRPTYTIKLRITAHRDGSWQFNFYHDCPIGGCYVP